MSPGHSTRWAHGAATTSHDPRHLRQHPAAGINCSTTCPAATPVTSGQGAKDARRRRSSTTPRRTTRRPASRWWCWAQGIPGPALPGLGGQRHHAARRARGHHRGAERIHRSNLIGAGVIPVQFPARRVGRVAGSWTARDLRHHRYRGAQQRQDAQDRQGDRHQGGWVEGGFDAVVRIDTPGRRTTTATAAFCSTCCGTCLRVVASPPAHAQSQRDHLAARRRQILDGARRCFAEYGYDKATVRRLEQTIGLSRGRSSITSGTKTRCSSSWPEDAERMADVATREGLIQVMRDLLAAPEQFDWLATRLEIARKLRNDPVFNQGLGRAVRPNCRPPRTTDWPGRSRPAGCVRMSPATCCRPTSIWCSTVWGGPAGIRRRSAAAVGRPRPRRGLRAAALSSLREQSHRSTAVIRPATAAHGGTRLTQHAVDRAVRSAGGGHQRSDARATLVGAAQVPQKLIACFVRLRHRRLPGVGRDPTLPG